MSDTPICPRCGKTKDHNSKIIIYRVNGKPVYEQLCKACLKEKWMSMREGFEVTDE